MDQLQLLISGYLDGELTNDEAARLAALLETDSDSLDRLAIHSLVHSQLLHWMEQQPDQPSAAAELGADRATLASPRGPWIWPRLRSFAAIAAAVVVAASISIVAYVIASRPVFVGQLTEATDCTWDGSQSDLGVGTLLQDGQNLQLVKGSAVITFSSGAKLYLEGPTNLRLHSPKEVQLLSGRVAAKVPRPAVGFTVTSSLAQFVDMGTEFMLALKAEKSFELHVFEGLVDVRLNERFGKAAEAPVHVAEIHAVSFNTDLGDVAPMHFQEGKEMPF
jgi:hypothetical protein